eukprot:TRINITY_DN1330_c1_g1_i6.p2 TRINITY_DN1330_c1_g1~~TRINITY_DN1330_c1_g1_i6.p2  ORF type:complete len:269 (-),score=36.27 TRINITY_DN1330_c1_g1_i6:255-1061(-)
MDLYNPYEVLSQEAVSPGTDEILFKTTKARKNGKTAKGSQKHPRHSQQYPLDQLQQHENMKNKSVLDDESLNVVSGWSQLSQGIEPEQLVLLNPLVWIDLEMTGLDLEKDTVLEIACLITDGQLKTVIEGPNLVVRHDKQVIDSMNLWCQQHHYTSGLVHKVFSSTLSMEEVEEKVLQFLKHYIGPQQAQLAGNTVHVDKMFLNKCMPKIVEYLHYRIVDVSTLKELCRRWYPKEFQDMPKKRSAHLAMDDIVQSIKELKYYRQQIFK